MSGTIGISCTTQNNKQNKNLYFKAIDVLETTYNSVKLSYLTNLDKPVNVFGLRHNIQSKFLYTAGPFNIVCSSDTDFIYSSSTKTLTIKKDCEEIDISNKDPNTPTDNIIVTEGDRQTAFKGKVTLSGVNINTNKDSGIVFNCSDAVGMELHISGKNTIEAASKGIYFNALHEAGGGNRLAESIIISGDDNITAQLISNKAGTNGIKLSGSPYVNLVINGGKLTIRSLNVSGNLIINGGSNLFTCESRLGSKSWDVPGQITLNSGVSVFEAFEPFGKYSLNNARSSSNITIGNSAVVSGSNDFYDACKNCNAGFSTCNTGIEMDKYTILEDGTIFVKEDIEYSQPDGVGTGFIGKDTKMRFKKINLSTGFILTNNGTIEIQGADVITGMYGKLINNGTIDNYGEIGEISTSGFRLENNGVINNYNEAKLYVLENITGAGNVNQIYTAPETTLTLSGQEGVDWVQEENRYLIKNTCNEITISGTTNKNIEAQSGIKLLTINLNNINAINSEIKSNRDLSINIKENTTNNLKTIDCYYQDISINANNNVNCILNLNEDNNHGVSINGGSYGKGITINGGIINASGIIGCEPCTSIKYVIVNDGIINTPQFGGGEDAYTSTITINGGMLFTNTLGCSGGDGNTGDVSFLGGVVRYNYWESYYGIEISDTAVIITPTQSIFDTLKSKNKGLIIVSEQFTSIDSLKIFDINNKTGEIIIKKPLTLNNSNNGSEEIMKINENCKVICNNLYFKDSYGNASTKDREHIGGGSKLINNGELTVSPGTRLYINCLEPYYLEHENNGIIYNLGEIDGKEYLKGTGRIIELDFSAEVNGELYNDITVDKVNRTVTINNLTPETDYDINLIASFEPYIERSKTIKQRILEVPPAILIDGKTFNNTIKGMSYFADVTEIRFEQKSGTLSGTDVSKKQDGSIKARISGDILYVEANGEIFANEDCSLMFSTLGNPLFDGLNEILNKITFNNFNTSNVTNMKAMFYYCPLLTNIDLNNFDTNQVTNMYEMFYNCSSLTSIKGLENFNISQVTDMSYMFRDCNKLSGSITIMNHNISLYDSMFYNCSTDPSAKFIVKYTDEATKTVAEKMVATKSENSNVYLDGTQPMIHGVRVDETNPNPETAVTYIEDAIGTATATSTSLGGWEDKYPFNKIRIVGFKNGKVVKEIKKEDKTKYIDGTTVSTDVDVMVEIPKVYWDFTNTDNGYELRICETKFSETSDCYAHKVGGVEKDCIYIGAYLGSVDTGRLRSRSGVAPTTSITLNNFRSYANNVGVGYQQFNWFTLMLLQNLYLLAYKNLNSQNALGYGYANSNSNKTNTGGTNTKGMIFGETGGKQQVCFLGIEDFYGNIFQWVDGMFHNNSYQVTVTPDNKTFNDNGSGFKNVGKFVNSNIYGKISKVAHTNEGGYFPKECNGSDTTYYCDYGDSYGGYFARFGGYWNYGLDAGAFYLDVSCSPSYSDSALGSRLVFLG